MREKADDPIIVFRNWLTTHQQWDDQQEEALLNRVREVVDDATDYAEQAPYPDPSTLLDHVYYSSQT